MSWRSPVLEANYGLRPEPFYNGIFYTVAGLLISWLIIRDTKGHAKLEASQVRKTTVGEEAYKPKTLWVLTETCWRNKTIFSVSQAGHHLNDGMSWDVFQFLFATAGIGLEGIGWIKVIYPVVWGLGMIFTGPLADRLGRKPLIVWACLFRQSIIW